jgi:hypothetical protein
LIHHLYLATRTDCSPGFQRLRRPCDAQLRSRRRDGEQDRYIIESKRMKYDERVSPYCAMWTMWAVWSGIERKKPLVRNCDKCASCISSWRLKIMQLSHYFESPCRNGGVTAKGIESPSVFDQVKVCSWMNQKTLYCL